MWVIVSIDGFAHAMAAGILVSVITQVLLSSRDETGFLTEGLARLGAGSLVVTLHMLLTCLETMKSVCCNKAAYTFQRRKLP